MAIVARTIHDHPDARSVDEMALAWGCGATQALERMHTQRWTFFAYLYDRPHTPLYLPPGHADTYNAPYKMEVIQ